jgi:hypothetical protein
MSEQSAWGEATEWYDNTFGDGQPQDQGPISVPEQPMTEEQKAYWDQQAKAGERITENQNQLRPMIDNAVQAGHIMYATTPNVDAVSASTLVGDLSSIASVANNACTGLDASTAAYNGFQTIAYWANAAGGQCSGIDALGAQEQHATLSELLNSLTNMQAGLSQI